ncbi:hypothetical protein FB451DRAFT_630118 [Mycena latifolia]|nr:hypothetical protein FB451DRAFT_630118 [Mycena latifolia]
MNPRSPPPFRRQPVVAPDSPFPPGSPRKKLVPNEIVLPKGNKLIVRGAYVSEASTHDPVRLVKASVDKLSTDALLETIPVTVVPFSDQFQNSSTAYVALHYSLNPVDPEDEPRWDLLEHWKIALQDANPTWEVAWTPATEGTDKRITVERGHH